MKQQPFNGINGDPSIIPVLACTRRLRYNQLLAPARDGRDCSVILGGPG